MAPPDAAAPTASPPRSGARRSSQIAIEHFALGGYNGTSTEAIAREAGISQPYLFRLFKTKRDLFLACHDALHERIRATFERRRRRRAARASALEAMGDAYIGAARGPPRAALPDAELRRLLGPRDPGARARRATASSSSSSRALSGAEPDDVWQFFSHGMLLNVDRLARPRAIADRRAWAAAWCDPAELIRWPAA